MTVIETIMDQINKLSLSEKILIVEEIWDSIANGVEYPELTSEQAEKLDKRIESYRCGRFEARPWEDIKKDCWR